MKGSYRTADGRAQIDWELADGENGPKFSASGEYKSGGGQVLDEIAKAYPRDEMVKRIVKVWRQYHLNDTTAGLPEQEAAIKEWLAAGNRYDYDKACKMLEERGLLVVPIPEGAKALGDWPDTYLRECYNCNRHVSGGHAASVCSRCKQATLRGEPVHVYRYGSRWVYSAIPADVLDEIKSWANVKQPRKPLHEDAATAFLSRNGLKLRATHHGDKCPPFCDGSCNHGDHYRITIWRAKRREPTIASYESSAMGQRGVFTGHVDHPRRLSFDFWNSCADMVEGREPTAYNVLACLSSDAYCPDSFEEFCSEYGYDEDSAKARQTWKRCTAFADRINAFFDGSELEELAEIR